MDVKVFKDKKVNVKKLVEYGFKKQNNSYYFSAPIVNNQFEMQIWVETDGEMKIKTVEIETDDEYIVHLTDVAGNFVGAVRADYEKVIDNILLHCYELDIFKSEQAHAVIEYIGKKYGDELEYLWPKFPNNAIWRRADNKKWYALIMTIPKQRLDLAGEDEIEIMDLRADENVAQVDNKTIFMGYHMNKRHWITICLNNTLPTQKIYTLIDNSYALAKKR